MDFISSLNIFVVKSPNLLYQALGKEAVILNMDNEQYYGLDERGIRLWQLLDDHPVPATLVPQILMEYDVAEEALVHDLAVFINDLQSAGLVTVQST